MRRATVVVLFLMVGAVMWAQETQPAYDKFPLGLGISGGGATSGTIAPVGGTGLAFQQWFGGIGYQVALGPYYDQSAGVLQDWVNVEGYFRLLGAEFSDWFYSQLYLFAAEDQSGNLTLATMTYAPEFLTSVGFGFQAGFFQHFVVSLNLGYGMMVPNFWVGLVVHAGLDYRF